MGVAKQAEKAPCVEVGRSAGGEGGGQDVDDAEGCRRHHRHEDGQRHRRPRAVDDTRNGVLDDLRVQVVGLGQGLAASLGRGDGTVPKHLHELRSGGADEDQVSGMERAIVGLGIAHPVAPQDLVHLRGRVILVQGVADFAPDVGAVRGDDQFRDVTVPLAMVGVEYGGVGARKEAIRKQE